MGIMLSTASGLLDKVEQQFGQWRCFQGQFCSFQSVLSTPFFHASVLAPLA